MELNSAFIAIGLDHFDVDRAAGELTTLFAHQWSTGKVPRIVFDPEAPPGSYFPGGEHWASEAESLDRPPMTAPTSGLCQPPVHAIAAWHIRETAGLRGGGAPARTLSLLEEIYPKLFSRHRYLANMRDPEESGLVTIYHPLGERHGQLPR